MIEVSDSLASAERRRSGGPDASPAAAASSSAAPGAAPEASSAKPVPAGQPFRCRLFRWPCLCLFGLPAGYLLVAVVSWRAPWVTLTGMEVVAASLGPLNIAGVTEISSTPASWHHVFGAFTLTGRACVHVHNPSVVPVQVSKLVGTLSINNIDASTKLEGVKLVMPLGQACVPVEVTTGDIFQDIGNETIRGRSSQTVEELMNNEPISLQAELTLSTLSFHLLATHIMAICEVTVQVCPPNLCQAVNFFDPMSLARIASSQLGVPEEAQCLVEQTGCFAELRRRERAPNVTRINCTSIAVEVSRWVPRRLADLGLGRRGTLRPGAWQRRVGILQRGSYGWTSAFCPF